MFTKKICLLALSAIGTVPVWADAQSMPDANDYFAKLPVVLTPSRLPLPLDEAPAAVTVLDGDLIRATGYRDIARLFRLVPGMQVGQERGGSHWVTYHGLGNDLPADMQVLVDGRAVYSPGMLGGVDWLALPVTIDEIDRIEIVRGTDAVAYGPNAFLGVINIITRPAGSTPGIKLSGNIGNQNIRDVSARWDSCPGSHTVRLAAASRSDQGFERLHDSSRMNIFSLRSDHQLTDKDQAMLRLTASDGTRGNGYPDSPLNNHGERTMETRNTSLHVQWRHLADADEEILVNYFQNNMTARDQWIAVAPRIDQAAPFPLNPVPLNRDGDVVRHSLELQHRLAAGSAGKLVWGGEARHESVDAPFIYYGQDTLKIRLFRLFGNLEWRFAKNWIGNLGLMSERYSDDHDRYSPRAFLNWHASPQTTLRAGYSRAWRDRNLLERYGEVYVIDPNDGALLARPYVQNPDLTPPRMDSYEIGWLERFRPGNSQLDLRIFNERITDFVVRRQVSVAPENPLLAAPPISLPSMQYYNLDTPVTLRGLEYQINTQPWADGRIILNHLMIDRRITDPGARARVAPYTASLSWLQNWPGNWSSMVTALRMGPLAGGDGFFGSHHYQAPAYTTYDFSLQRRLRWGDYDVRIALSGINLGGRHQEIPDRSQQSHHPEGPVNPVSRMIFLSLTLRNR